MHRASNAQAYPAGLKKQQVAVEEVTDKSHLGQKFPDSLIQAQ
jgi:hypothetical protein